MRTAIYAGTFDPVTLGHLDVIERATRLFDEIIVTVARNAGKNPLFAVEERIRLLEQATASLTGVRCEVFEGLLVDFAVRNRASVLIRGLRTASDFEYEQQMAHMNRRLAEKLVTVFMMPNEKYTFLSSSIVKEVASHGGAIDTLVTPEVAARLKEKFNRK